MGCHWRIPYEMPNKKTPQKKLLISLLLCFLYGFDQVVAQTAFLSEAEVVLWEDWFEEDSEADQEVLEEMLLSLLENPVNLNAAQKKDLERLFFLSPEQIDQLGLYLYRNAPLASVSELLLVESIDEQTVARLRPFVRLGEWRQNPTASPPLSWCDGRHAFRSSLSSTRPLKQGYRLVNDSLREASKAYLGNALSASLRYDYRLADWIQTGFVLEKDAGEAGVDFFSFHFSLNNRHGFEALILGDYRAGMGQGLVLSSGFSGGKYMAMDLWGNGAQGLRRHFSCAESGFMRGVAAQFRLSESLEGLLLVSGRRVDAGGNETDGFASLKTDGKHRTTNEMLKKENLLLHQYGAQLRYAGNHVSLGGNLLYYRYGGNIRPEVKPYNLFYFRGTSGWNASMDYRFLWGNLLCSGEWAFDAQGAMALLNQCYFSLSDHLRMFVLLRSYSPEYNAPFAAAFSENSSVRNERGLFVGMDGSLFPHWTWRSQMDVFSFPWLKYGVHSPSYGHELSLESAYSPATDWKLQFRFREKSKLKNDNESTSAGIYPCVPYTRRQYRIQWIWQKESWRMKCSFDKNTYQEPDKAKTHGCLFAQELRYKSPNESWALTCQYALFDALEYDNRLSFYECGLPGSFSISSMYGRGSRYALLFAFQPAEHWKCHLKLRHTLYRHKESIGESLEYIPQAYSTDIGLMLQARF